VIAIRAVVPDDRDRVAAFVRELTPQSRRRRFFSAIRELSAAMLDRLTHPDPARELVLVAVSGAGPNRRILGIAQVATADDAEVCEFALVVADDLQGQGLGMRMMDALMDAACAAGYREVVGEVLTDNRAMLALARRAGFEARSSGDPMLTRIVRVVANRPSAPRLGRFRLWSRRAAVCRVSLRSATRPSTIERLPNERSATLLGYQSFSARTLSSPSATSFLGESKKYASERTTPTWMAASSRYRYTAAQIFDSGDRRRAAALRPPGLRCEDLA
jgi:RimJ/RimL family protein N-acetyltransferase